MSHTDFNLGDFFRVLKKWLALVIILPVAAGTAAYVYFYVTYVPQYTSTAIVACSSKQASSGNIDGSTLSTSKDVAKSFKYMITQSTTLQDAADILHENPKIIYNDYTSGTLAGMISVSQVEDTYFLTISATASNRWVACDVANAVADASVNLAGEDVELTVETERFGGCRIKEITEISASDPLCRNTFDRPDAIKPVTKKHFDGEIILKPYSVNFIDYEID